MVVLITDGVKGGYLGMVTAFYHNDQVKMEAAYTLVALHQCDSPEPRVDVVKQYTNTPYIP